MTSPDHRVALPDTSYFFIGNGLVRAAVQFAAGGEGSPLGLVIDDPARLVSKRDALSMGPNGLGAVSVRIRLGDLELVPEMPNLSVRWETDAGAPVVVAYWGHADLSVRERFYMLEGFPRQIVREIGLLNGSATDLPVTLLAGEGRAVLSQALVVPARDQASLGVVYESGSAQPSIGMRFTDVQPPAADAWWAGLTDLALGHDLLEHAFRASRRQLPAAIAADGIMPARMWSGPGGPADIAAVAVACLQLGCWTAARRALERAESPAASSDAGRAAVVDAWQQYRWWTGSTDLPVFASPAAPARGAEAVPSQTVGIITDAQAALDDRDLERAAADIAWLGAVSGARAGSWFTAYDASGEPQRGDAGEADVSVRAWAEIVRLAVAHVLGVRPAADGVFVRPRLLPGVVALGARLRVRNMALRLDVVADESVEADVEYLLPYDEGDVTVRLGARPSPATT